MPGYRAVICLKPALSGSGGTRRPRAATMTPMSRWDEPTLEDEIAWLARDLNDAEDVRDALPPASRDRALVEETIRSLGLRLTDLLHSSGRQGDDS
jgi:hypothetical protein